jgi:DHA3 family tetracycline resistance protein-like MFS transporter
MRTRDARVVYLVLESATALLQATVWTTAAVYFITDAHLGPLQLVLLGTVMELSILVFEIPTGIVADAVRRRRSVLLGTTLMGVALVLTGMLPSFPALLGAQALWGLGYTFTSGATEAWVAGEVGDEAVGPLLLRAAQYANLAAALGIGLSVGLANLVLRLPLVTGGVLQVVLAAWLALAMPETGFRPVPREQRSTWRHLARTAGDGLAAARRNRVLLALLVVALFAGMSTEGIDRLWELHLLREVGLPGLGRLGPVTWFGIIQLASLGLATAVIGPARKRVDTSDPRALCRLLLVLTMIEAATVVAFGLAGSFGLAVAALLGYGGVRGLREPLYGAWVVPMIQPPQVRATVLSTVGQADAVGEVLGGPAIGLAAALTSPGLAIVAAGSALAPVAILLGGLSTSLGQPQDGGGQPLTEIDPGEGPHLVQGH